MEERKLSEKIICEMLSKYHAFTSTSYPYCVCGDKIIGEEASLYVNARLYSNAKVSGNAWIFENARVFGDAKVHGDVRC